MDGRAETAEAIERRAVSTREGVLWLWGRSAAFAEDRPLVFAILGAFAPRALRLQPLETALPVSVISALLPGQRCPGLRETTVEAYARAFDEAAEAQFANRRTIICGESAGGLVALAMEHQAAARLILEPPLRTSKLWPALSYFRGRLAEDPTQGDFLWNIMGVSADRVEDRDHTALLIRDATVLVGADPTYPVRPFRVPPSAVDAPERALMASLPNIRLREIAGAGHDIPGATPGAFVEAVRALL